jgi:hypothetical protein
MQKALLAWPIEDGLAQVNGGKTGLRKPSKIWRITGYLLTFDNPQDPFIKQVCDPIQRVLPLLELAAAEAIKRSFFDLGLDGDPMDTSD